jgi:hypothetical protein
MFHEPYRPEIQLDISRWKYALFIFHSSIFLLGTFYLLIKWQYIPNSFTEITRGVIRMVPKESLIAYHFCTLSPALFSFFALNVPAHKVQEGRGRSVSHNLKKAKKQYLIEKSLYSCCSLIVHIFLSLFMIISIEKHLNRIYIPYFWWAPFPICAGLILLIHHVRWTRLSDK